MSPSRPNDIDLEKCLTSGQVFRWRKLNGSWLGVDGDHIWQLPPDWQPTEEDPDPLRRFFRLDWDYQDLAAKLMQSGPELERYLTRAQGLRLLRPSCARETLFSFLCTSNNHISRITQMVAKLAGYGSPIPGSSQHRFPSLERLAEVTESELREKGFGYRAATIPLVAHELLARGGEPYLAQTSQRPYPDVFTELIALPGVGPKLADCIALYAFDMTEAVPIDVHMWRSACPVYFPDWTGTDLTDVKRRALGDKMRNRFGKLAGVAQQVLFYASLSAAK